MTKASEGLGKAQVLLLSIPRMFYSLEETDSELPMALLGPAGPFLYRRRVCCSFKRELISLTTLPTTLEDHERTV